MSFQRHLLEKLEQWKISKDRKPLIMRGARQVGKTTLVKQFSASFRQFIHINLELDEDFRLFTTFKDVPRLVEALFIANSLPIEEKAETLLFIDEIQESPEAIGMLRYFYEQEPELPVIAAGLLLEHAMHKVRSFPVGRVQMLHMYPMNFMEFILGLGQKNLSRHLLTVPVRDVAHPTLLNWFNQYAIIGGMPEVVHTYLQTKSVATLQSVYESIWETYKEDVVKYADTDTEARVIRHIMQTAHLKVDTRIKFQHFGQSNYRSREVGEAFRKLDDARIIQLIYPTTDVTPPIQSDLQKSPRLQFLDTGLVNYELNIQSAMLAMNDLNDAYRGAIIPHLITQELMSLNTSKATKPNFWVREKNQSSAEVDLLVQHGPFTIPIEIKSGKEGKLKSLHQFIQASPHPYAVRMYAGPFSVEQHTTREGKKYLLMNLPYYLGTQLHEYLTYFTENYSVILS